MTTTDREALSRASRLLALEAGRVLAAAGDYPDEKARRESERLATAAKAALDLATRAP